MGQFRPPRIIPGLTEEQSHGIFAELDRIKRDLGTIEGANNSTRIWSDALVPTVAGDVLRLQPRGATPQRVMLPNPKRTKIGAFVDLLVDCSKGGTVRVFVSSSVKITLVGPGLVNGEASYTISATGWYRFECDGDKGWFTIPPGGDLTATQAEIDAINVELDDAPYRVRYKEIYYTNGDCEIYDETNTLISTSTLGTWSRTSSGKTKGKAYKVWVCSGGTGGCRSNKRAGSAVVADEGGSAGSGGCAVAEHVFNSFEIDAHITAIGSSIAVTVGAGGSGAAQGTLNTSVQASAQGTLGGVSAFGALLAAYPGGRGSAPNGATAGLGGGGGGWMSGGQDGAAGGGIGGQPTFISTQQDGGFGGGAGHDGGAASTTRPGASVYGGGGGGGSVATTGVAHAGGKSLRGGGGSGAGGGTDGTGPAIQNGSAAGSNGFYSTGGTANTVQSGGGPAGGAGATGNTGNNGTDGAAGIPGLRPGTSGGGGGALLCNTAGGTGVSGRGGDGGFPGGSGGSSGVCVTLTGSAQSCAAARGGHGANGAVVVFTLG